MVRSCNLIYNLLWRSGGKFSPVVLFLFLMSSKSLLVAHDQMKVDKSTTNTSLFHNDCRKAELIAYCRRHLGWSNCDSSWGELGSVVRDGFTLLCWSHSLMSYLLLPPWQVGCYRVRHMGTKCCRGFSGSEVMSFLAQDKSGNKMVINYKVRLLCNSNKCVCLWRLGWLIACTGHMALRKWDLPSWHRC